MGRQIKSILQKDADRCYICGSPRWLEWHHIFGAAYRRKSETYGLIVRLCHFCHNEPPDGVHQNKVIRDRLRAKAQKQAMDTYGWTAEMFIAEFGKNYL